MKHTPVPELSPLLPKTIWTTFTAVPSVSGNVVRPPVDLRARRVPRVEDRANGARQLLARVLGEVVAGLVQIDPLVRLDQTVEVVVRELDVLLRAALGLQVRERLLEAVPVDPVDDLAVHLDQAPVGVVGEARVAGPRREPRERVVVQAEVQDRVHHPGHRDRGPGADRDEQRVVGVAEALAGLLLQRGDVLVDLGVEPVRELLAVLHVRAAGVSRDREAGGHGNAERGHLREPDPLAAEQLAPAPGRLVEVVDEARRGRRHQRRRSVRKPCKEGQS